jgi:hypothetical protein
MNDERMVGSHHVEGWLMDVPNYRGDYHHKTERPIENSIQKIDVER